MIHTHARRVRRTHAYKHTHIYICIRTHTHAPVLHLASTDTQKDVSRNRTDGRLSGQRKQDGIQALFRGSRLRQQLRSDRSDGPGRVHS